MTDSNFATFPSDEGIELTSSISGTYNLLAGTNRTIVIVVVDEQLIGDGYREITSITLGSVSASLQNTAEVFHSSGAIRNNSLTYIIAEEDLPSDGSQPLSISWDGDGTRKAYVWQLDDTDQDDPITVTSAGTNTESSVSVPYASEDTSVYLAIGNNGNIFGFQSLPEDIVEQNSASTSNGSGASFIAGRGVGLDSPPGVFDGSPTNRLVGVIIQSNPGPIQITPDLIPSEEEVFDPLIERGRPVVTSLSRLHVLQGTT